MTIKCTRTTNVNAPITIWIGKTKRMFTELAAAELLRKLTDAINYTIESPPSDVR